MRRIKNKIKEWNSALLEICAKCKEAFSLADVAVLLRLIYHVLYPFIQLEQVVTTQCWLHNQSPLLFLHGEVTVAPQPSRFISSIPSKNVAPRVRLKIPRRNKHNISDTNPNSPLQLSAHSTQTFMPILTFHDHSVKTKQLNSYTQHISSSWQLNPPKVRFTNNLSLTQSSLHL